MKLAPARREALAFLEGDRWLGARDWDDLLDSHYQRLPQARDRRLFSHLVSGCVRLRGRLDARLRRLTGREELDAAVQAALRLALYQLQQMDRVPAHAVVADSVEWVKGRRGPRLAGWVNAQLRRYLREGIPGSDPDPRRDPLVFGVQVLSYPAWLVERWLASLGEERAFALMAAMNESAGATFRWNARQPGLEEFLADLAGRGTEVQRPAGLPLAFRLPGSWPDSVHAALRAGRLSVQDEAAQRVAPLLAAASALAAGGHWADLCAAPGGQCCQLAEGAGPRAEILALDRSARRLEKVVANRQRLGLDRLRVETGALEELPPRPQDGVLLDAPCSSLGVLAANPDARWRKSEADITEQAAQQRRLLAAAATWVRPGGRLVYSVCTLSPEETGAQRRWFLEHHPDFVADPVQTGEAPRDGITEEGELMIWPEAGRQAGAYAARFRRRSS